MSNQLTNNNDTTLEQTARLFTIDYLSANEFTFKKPNINKNNKKKTKTHHFNLNDQSTMVNSPKSNKSILNQTTIQHKSNLNISIDTKLIHKLLNHPMSPSSTSYKSFSPKSCLTEGGYYYKQPKKEAYQKQGNNNTLTVNKSSIINFGLKHNKVAKPGSIKISTLCTMNSLKQDINVNNKKRKVSLLNNNTKQKVNTKNNINLKTGSNYLNKLYQKYEKQKQESQVKLEIIEMMIKDIKKPKMDHNKTKTKTKAQL